MEETSIKHSLTMYERNEVLIEGVIKLDSFNKEEFLIDTTKGFLHIKGKNLTLGNMDMDKSTISIEGNVDSIAYLNKSNVETQKESFLKKLFK